MNIHKEDNPSKTKLETSRIQIVRKSSAKRESVIVLRALLKRKKQQNLLENNLDVLGHIILRKSSFFFKFRFM